MKALQIFSCIALLGFFTGCGFTPVHGTFGAASDIAVQDSLARIHIDNIPNREGQFLRNALMDRFYTTGRPQSPVYRLAIQAIQERKTDLDITKSSDATRAQLRLESELVLYSTSGNEELLSRKLLAVTSYNILQSQFTTRVSEQNARENAIISLAEQIERQLALYFKRTQ